MDKMLSECRLCARLCGVNRYENTGFCGAGEKVKISRAALHFWEEPCISGDNGSGTIFFSHCSLGCVYCQNHEISTDGLGKEISNEALADKMLTLQSQGAHNINLVTPTHYVPQIINALNIAKRNGLCIPIVYNTGSYDTAETIRMLDGCIDIYLPDLKYYNEACAIKYSHAPHYFDIASKAINEMVKQTGSPKFDQNGIMQNGVIVRHMLLPHLLFDSKKIIDYLYTTYGDGIYISIMSQYTPTKNAQHFKELTKPIDTAYYNALIDYAARIGVTNAYVQEDGAADESFIPPFNPDEI